MKNRPVLILTILSIIALSCNFLQPTPSPSVVGTALAQTQAAAPSTAISPAMPTVTPIPIQPTFQLIPVPPTSEVSDVLPPGVVLNVSTVKVYDYMAFVPVDPAEYDGYSKQLPTPLTMAIYGSGANYISLSLSVESVDGRDPYSLYKTWVDAIDALPTHTCTWFRPSLPSIKGDYHYKVETDEYVLLGKVITFFQTHPDLLEDCDIITPIWILSTTMGGYGCTEQCTFDDIHKSIDFMEKAPILLRDALPVGLKDKIQIGFWGMTANMAMAISDDAAQKIGGVTAYHTFDWHDKDPNTELARVYGLVPPGSCVELSGNFAPPSEYLANMYIAAWNSGFKCISYSHAGPDGWPEPMFTWSGFGLDIKPTDNYFGVTNGIIAIKETMK